MLGVTLFSWLKEELALLIMWSCSNIYVRIKAMVFMIVAAEIEWGENKYNLLFNEDIVKLIIN